MLSGSIYLENRGEKLTLTSYIFKKKYKYIPSLLCFELVVVQFGIKIAIAVSYILMRLSSSNYTSTFNNLPICKGRRVEHVKALNPSE